jgi:uncharacterized protein involved in exopolysaccharide biosynthesis
MPQRDLAYWIDLLQRRRVIAIQIAVIVFGLVLVGTLMWPPTYESTAKILVQDQREQYLVSPNLQDDPMAKQAVGTRPVTQEALNSEVEMLTSLQLIEASLAGLRPPTDNDGLFGGLSNFAHFALDLPAIGYGTLHNTPLMNANQRWALKLSRHLHPSVIKMSDIIEVSFTTHDPTWAQTFLSRLLDQYLDYHSRLTSDPQAEKFFDQQAKILEAKLDDSEDKLRQFEVQNGITDLVAQKQALVKRLSDLEIEDNRVNARLAAAREQIVSLDQQLTSTPQRIGKESRSVQNAALQALKPQVMQLKAERAELLSRYQPTSQRIQEIDAKLAAAQRILDQENHLEVQESSTDLNPIWVTLDTSREQAKVSVAVNEATDQVLTQEIQKARGDITGITNAGVELARLQRQVDTDKGAYISYVRKGEEARTAQALNLSKILNVSLAQPPSLPLQPTYPKVWLNLIVGLILAAALGVGAAYWEEQRDDRIYSPASIAEISGLRTVAVFREET